MIFLGHPRHYGLNLVNSAFFSVEYGDFVSLKKRNPLQDLQPLFHLSPSGENLDPKENSVMITFFSKSLGSGSKSRENWEPGFGSGSLKFWFLFWKLKSDLIPVWFSLTKTRTSCSNQIRYLPTLVGSSFTRCIRVHFEEPCTYGAIHSFSNESQPSKIPLNL